MNNTLPLKTDKAKTHWYYWLFPLIALIISGWIILDFFKKKGPSIKIYFKDASNIQEGKTLVRFLGVTIGRVTKIGISENNKEVIVYVDLQKEAEQIAVEGSKFWVVIPKVNFSGVSGLETLFEGTYIAVQPGKASSNSKFEFTGQLGSDTNEAIENTSSYEIETSNVESISAGDVVTYRGVIVGSIARVNLNKSAQIALVQVNIQNKFTKLIRNNTVFSKKVGVKAKLGIFGSEFKLNSFESIMHGGLEFFTPKIPGKLAKEHTHFLLLPNPPVGAENWSPNLDF